MFTHPLLLYCHSIVKLERRIACRQICHYAYSQALIRRPLSHYIRLLYAIATLLCIHTYRTFSGEQVRSAMCKAWLCHYIVHAIMFTEKVGILAASLPSSVSATLRSIYRQPSERVHNSQRTSTDNRRNVSTTVREHPSTTVGAHPQSSESIHRQPPECFCDRQRACTDSRRSVSATVRAYSISQGTVSSQTKRRKDQTCKKKKPPNEFYF